MQKFVINENPLAAQYPTSAYTGGKDRNPNGAMKEGDTPAWFYFINNGLNHPPHPEWGGWGGRFSNTGSNLFTDTKEAYSNKETGITDYSSLATVYRWRPDFQQDFAARVQWAVKSYKEANHHPVAVIRNDENGYDMEISARRGQRLAFDASSSYDPDGNGLHYKWYIYPAEGQGNTPGNVILHEAEVSHISIQVPAGAKQDSLIHLILELRDDAEYPLTAYKRMVIRVIE